MNDQSDSSAMANQSWPNGVSKLKRSAGSNPTVFSSLQLEVVVEDGDWTALEQIDALVEETVAALAKHLCDRSRKAATPRGYQVALALTSDAHVARLNETYRGRQGPTNVLSFPNPMTMQETDERTTLSTVHLAPIHLAPTHLGDIVMAHQTMMEEANALAIPPKDHFRHLLVHGLLHLAGYDHETDEQAQVMEAQEVEILKTLGVPDPYSIKSQS